MRYLVVILLLSACSFNDVTYSIEPDLNVYVESFYKEALIRGYDLRTPNLLVFKESDLYQAKARIRTGSNGQIKVVFDKEWVDFNLRTYPERVESVMFHELGHALLHRDHAKGCYSLMLDGGCEACYENKPEMRKKLIDELFNPCSD